MTDNNITNFPDLGPALTRDIIGCAIKVHKYFGPGLLETIYGECLAIELTEMGYDVQAYVSMPVSYEGHIFEDAYTLDLWIEKKVVVKFLFVEEILPIHEAQILNYMRHSQSPLGLLMNFNETLLKNGIKRYALTEFAEKKEDQ